MKREKEQAHRDAKVRGSNMPHPEEFTDTDPRAMEVWLDIQRRMTAGEKLAATLKASDFLLKTWESEVRAEHPHVDEIEVRLRVAARHLSRDLMIRAYGWDPKIHGISDPANDTLYGLPFGGTRMDMDYVRHWAAQLKVGDLLDRLLAE
jgi:hypothetical protein